MTVPRWHGWPARAFLLAMVLAVGLTACGQRTAVDAVTTCSWPGHSGVAARLAADVTSTLRGRSSVVGFAAADPAQGLRCALNPLEEFHSASIVKVIILAALLHEDPPSTYLTPEQVTLSHEMITESDNTAATDLWDEVGMQGLQKFLTAAGMHHTELGQHGYWGLTDVNAHDELRLLQLLITPNSVLDSSSRGYILRLMNHVIPSQHWGVSAGVPVGVTVYLKDGWLPDPALWIINSIGDFTAPGGDYSMAILTRGNPTMPYGVDTVQAVAQLVNRALARQHE